jgi:magnesium-transporting ATPase (P-type)
MSVNGSKAAAASHVQSLSPPRRRLTQPEIKEVPDLQRIPLQKSDTVPVTRRESVISTRGASKINDMFTLQQDQVFLGMIASSIQPKREVSQIVEDLNDAGIRFVYFSPRHMRRSKSFVEKMGINLDWNSAISLRTIDEGMRDNPAFKFDFKGHDFYTNARLPYGTKQIRKHLEEVDDVPLLVSLFTDSSPADVREMIGIFQEYDEVVCCVGSSLQSSNTDAFCKADLSISVNEMPGTLDGEPLPRVLKSSLCSADLAFVGSLNTISCSLNMPLYSLVHCIKEGRRVINNKRQTFQFTLTAHLVLAEYILVGSLMPFFHSPTLDGIPLMWMLLVIIPSLSFSLFGTPASDNTMKVSRCNFTRCN